MKKRLSILVVIGLVFVMLCSCASDMESSTSDTYMSKSNAAPEVDYAGSAEYLLDEVALTNNSDGNINEDKKVIKTAGIQLETYNYDETMKDVTAMIGNNGYIESSNVWKTPKYKDGVKYLLTNATITVRIPKDQFQSFVDATENVGVVIQKNTDAQDISFMYYDTEARVDLKKDEKDRLEEYLNEIDDAEIYFQIQSRITEVIYEIEQLQGTLLRWEDEVQYSTITLTINEIFEEDDSVIYKPKGFFEKIWNSIEDGVTFIGQVTIVLFAALPTLIVIGLAIFIFIRLLNRKKRKKDKNNKNNKID